MANPTVDFENIAQQLAVFSAQLQGIGHVPHGDNENRIARLEEQAEQMGRDIQSIRETVNERLARLETKFLNDHSRTGNAPIRDLRTPLFALRDVRTGLPIPGLPNTAAAVRYLDDAAVDGILAALDWEPGDASIRSKQDFLLYQMGWTGTFYF